MNLNKLDRTWLWAVLAIAWMALIYALSDRPASGYEGVGGLLSWLPFASVIAHIGLYFVLSAFVLRTLVLVRPVSEALIAYSTIFIALVYGVLDEIHQSNVEGRASEVIDVVADVFGAVLVVVFWFLIKKYRSRSSTRTIGE
jgi:VanZ family protein